MNFKFIFVFILSIACTGFLEEFKKKTKCYLSSIADLKERGVKKFIELKDAQEINIRNTKEYLSLNLAKAKNYITDKLETLTSRTGKVKDKVEEEVKFEFKELQELLQQLQRSMNEKEGESDNEVEEENVKEEEKKEEEKVAEEEKITEKPREEIKTEL